MLPTGYSKRLRKHIDFRRYHTLMKSVGSQLNSRKDRFDKSDIIEQAIAIYSNGTLQWVDQIGYDVVDREANVTVEIKFIEHGIFTRSGRPKAFTSAKIKNSLGSHKGVAINNHADYYLFCQSDAIALVDWSTLSNYLVAVPDGIDCRIPHEKLLVIFKPSDVISTTTHTVNYKEAKALMQKRLIMGIS